MKKIDSNSMLKLSGAGNFKCLVLGITAPVGFGFNLITNNPFGAISSLAGSAATANWCWNN